jgi:hypothetical protein
MTMSETVANKTIADKTIPDPAAESRPSIAAIDDDLGGVLIFCGIGLLLAVFAALVAWPSVPAMMY